jgi:serine O-acetyltransferase
MQENHATSALGHASADHTGLGSHIATIATLKQYIFADLRSRGNRGSFAKIFLFDPVARFTVLLRVLEFVENTGKPPLIRLPVLFWYRRLSIRLGFSLAPGIFGSGLAIVHYGLVIVNPATRVGRNCRIHAGVNIGGAAHLLQPGDTNCYSPRIGHNVYIAPGAKLYGPIRIGNDCTIGANAVVTHSFPEDGLVIAGVPAKVIARETANRRIIKGAD